MKQSMGFNDKVGASLERQRKPSNPFKLAGRFKIEQWRDGKLFKTYEFDNGITNIGKNTILTSFFFNTAPPTTWYLGLIDNAGFTALAPTDTMGSHAGWAESTVYSEVTRPAWVTAAAASQSITNSTPATFSITGTATLKGIFVPDENTKSGSTGTLWSTALFGGDIPVANLDILKITYSVNAT